MPIALRLRLEVYYRIGVFLLMQSSPARGGSGIKGLEATGNYLVFARAKRFCRVGCRGDRPGPRDTKDHPLFSGRKTRPVGRSEKGAYVNLAVNAAYPHKPLKTQKYGACAAGRRWQTRVVRRPSSRERSLYETS